MKAFLYAVTLMFCLMFQCEQSLYAADLYAFLVGDYSSQDIQQASRTDLKNMYEEAKRIADYGGYKLKASFFAGEKKSGEKLLKALKKLSPTREDLVLFYFSGHGYRTSNHSPNPWPYLDFPDEHRGMSFKDVITHVTDLNPRLTILIADCCNWAIPTGFVLPPLLKGHKARFVSTRQIKRNYKKLFCHTEGVIAIAGAQPGHASYCKTFGSFYTLSFLSSLQEVLHRQSGVDWESVIYIAESNLIEMLMPYSLNQTPVVSLTLK